MSSWRDGPVGSSRPCTGTGRGPSTGWSALRDARQGCSPTGACSMAAAAQWEPDDARVSCPVLRERGGGSPRATHLVVGFEHEADARRFWEAMRERLQEFALSPHPDKARLLECGRFAAANRKRRGLGKPETFTFLGFTFICGRTRRGDFQIHRKTRRCRRSSRRSRRNCDGGCTSPFPNREGG